jgi:hypothetical protein
MPAEETCTAGPANKSIGRVASVSRFVARRFTHSSVADADLTIVRFPRGARAKAWGERLSVEPRPGRALEVALLTERRGFAGACEGLAACTDDGINEIDAEDLAALYPEVAALYPDCDWLREIALAQHHGEQAA